MKHPPLPASLLAQIAQHAQECYPEEACGAWSTASTGASQVHPLPNVAPRPQRTHRFVADPLGLLALLEAHDRAELHLQGFYHSHPNTPPTLSTTDKALHTHQGIPLYPSMALLIVSLQHKDQPSFALYRWNSTTKQYTPSRHDTLQATPNT